METLAAVGLASNVMQFVGFISELISLGSEIHNSVDGSSERMLELQSIYQSLSGFNTALKDGKGRKTSENALTLQGFKYGGGSESRSQSSISIHVNALHTLAAECDDVCQQLLDTVQKISVKGGHRQPFRSFKAALKTMWDNKKIVGLEERLDRFQRMISLHFYPILRCAALGNSQKIALIVKLIMVIIVPNNQTCLRH